MQDALLKAIASYSQLETMGPPPPGSPRSSSTAAATAHGRARRPEVVELDEVEEFSLFRTIADEDPFPHSDSLHLDFLQQFGAEDVRAVLASLPERYRVPLVLVYLRGLPREGGRVLPRRPARDDARRASTGAASCSSGACGTTLKRTDS